MDRTETVLGCSASHSHPLTQTVFTPGPATNATLVIVEAVVHDDLGTEDMPIRHLVDVQMMAIVDGRERSQARSVILCATPLSTYQRQMLLEALVNTPWAGCRWDGTPAAASSCARRLHAT